MITAEFIPGKRLSELLQENQVYVLLWDCRLCPRKTPASPKGLHLPGVHRGVDAALKT